MRKVKRLIGGTAALAAVLVLAACGASSGSKTATNSASGGTSSPASLSGQSITLYNGQHEQTTAKLGVPFETRAYAPHLTLARVKYAVPLGDLIESAGNPDFGAFQASSFFLYLSSNGRYSKLAEFPLHS